MKYFALHLFVFLALNHSAAKGQHSADVLLQVLDGKIETGGTVFATEFGEIVPNEVDEPGFDSLAGTFPAGSAVGFTILDALRRWDGSDFDEISAEPLGIQFGSSLGPIFTPSSPTTVPGFELNVANDGSWHRHLDFVLQSPASSGIYLLSLQLYNTTPGIVSSDPIYIVFNQNDTELRHDQAVARLEEQLKVPEPGGLSLIAIFCGLFSLRLF